MYPVDFYLLRVNYRNTKTRCEISSKLTKATELRQWHRSVAIAVVFNCYLVLCFLLRLVVEFEIFVELILWLCYFRPILFILVIYSDELKFL